MQDKYKLPFSIDKAMYNSYFHHKKSYNYEDRFVDQYIVHITWPNEKSNVSGEIIKNNVPGRCHCQTLSSSESEWIYDILENGYKKSLKKHMAEKKKRKKKNPLITLDRDLYGAPNVVEVVYSNDIGYTHSRIQNDEENKKKMTLVN